MDQKILEQIENNFLSKFEEVPRLNFRDSKIDELIATHKPVLILDSDLVKPACDKWNLDYLENHLGSSTNNVFLSKNRKFKFFDDKKILSPTNPKGVEFSPPTKKVEMKIGDFMNRIREYKNGDERAYLQQSLTSTVGSAIVEDFGKFHWEYVTSKQRKHNWGPLTSNVLFIAQENNVTPCHFDEQQNFFAQVQGRKQVLLFPPDQFENLYPHPVYHPHDRQSMVDFYSVDHIRFPKFKYAKGFKVIVEPNEVLYIPIYWWHHIESYSRGPTISVNFWYKDGPTNLEYPLKDHQKVSIMRNVEKMLHEVLQDPKEVGPLLRAMVLGRYTNE